MTPLFSLILPCYNVAAYVERCVHSILSQREKDYEIILVDDGSTDATPTICDALAAEYPSIRVLHKENGGLASARNAGMRAAVGEYIWFIDSDDWIEPEALTVLTRACSDGVSDLVKFNHYRVGTEKKCVPGLAAPGVYKEPDQLEKLRQMAFGSAGKYVLSAWSHVYRSVFLRQHQLAFVSERVICSEDYLFNLQALLHAESVCVLDDALYCYALRAGSLTQTYKPDIARRYTELYRLLKHSYHQMDAIERYGALIDRFYVWHLIIGTCFQHEYRIHQERKTLSQARKNVREIMQIPEVKRAAVHSDRTGLSWKKQIQLLAVCMHLEPVFYWLCAVKPQLRRSHEKGMIP